MPAPAAGPATGAQSLPMIFGSDTVTAPAGANSNTPNSAYTVTPSTTSNSSFTFGSIPPTSPVVSSSTPASNAINNLGNNIGSASGTPVVPASPVIPGYNPSYDPSTDPQVASDTAAANAADIARQQQLDAQQAAEVASLQQQEGVDKSTLNTTQANETGTTNRNLLSLQQGGQSASAQAYLNSLVTTHQNEMNALQAKYDQAIATANNAYSDKDFQLAQDQAKNAKDIRDEAVKRNQAFLDNYDKIQTQNREDATAAFNQQQAVVKANTDNLTWARTNGLHPGAQFFASGGQIYNAADGSSAGSTAVQLKAAGVADDLSNVQMIQAKRTGTLGDMDDYNQGLVAAGKPPLNIIQYTDMLQQQKVAIAAAGRSINVAQQQFDLTKEQTATLQNIVSDWQTKKVLQGNSTISSSDYKKAKIAFVGIYGADSAKAFDQAMSVFVDSSNQGGTNTNPQTGATTKIPDYKSDYGIN